MATHYDLELERVIWDFTEFVNRETEILKGETNDAEFESTLPDIPWIDNYLRYTRGIEGPSAYHIFSSLCVLGAANRGRANMLFGGGVINPMPSVILLGPPGIKKTTSADIAVNLVNRADGAPLNIIRDKLTPEALMSFFKENNIQFLYGRELSVMLSKKDYTAGLSSDIGNLLDGGAEIQINSLSAKKRGERYIKNPICSMLGCTHFYGLRQSMPADVVYGGFISRTIPIIATKDARCFTIPSLDGTRIPALLYDVQAMAGLSGDITFDQSAFQLYDEWYHDFKWSKDKMTPEEQNAKTRLNIHCLRLAMVLHMVGHQNLVLCRTCIAAAINMIDYINKGLGTIVHNMDDSFHGRMKQYVLKNIREFTFVERKICYHNLLVGKVSNQLRVWDLKAYLHTLEDSGDIITVKDAYGNGAFYIPVGGREEIDKGTSETDIRERNDIDDALKEIEADGVRNPETIN